MSINALGSAVYKFLLDVLIQAYERCFQDWIDRLKRRIRAGGEYFEGHRKVKLPLYVYLRRTKASDIIFGTPFVCTF